MTEQKYPSWSSRLGFMLACIGASVGLGNIWKFPYMAGENGGGAFVLIYLVTIALIAIPVAAAELVTGRAGRANANSSVKSLAPQHHNANLYAPIGLVGILGAFILLTFYNVIAGWVMAYVVRAFTGVLAQVNAETSDAIFSDLLANQNELIAWQMAFIFLVGLVIARNLNAGLERANLILMPLLLLMLFAIVIYGTITADMSGAMTFLFSPDFSKIDSSVVLSAVGHGFFSVGVGAAMLITYGAYVADDIKIGQASILIGIADTVVALLAGLGIFAIVFAQNLDPAGGPGLIFTTLPIAFAQMPGGGIIALVFFLLVLFAALTSALALTEAPVRWISETTRFSRQESTFIVLLAAFIIGLATVFSFNIWADLRIASDGTFANKTLFDVKDYIASNILLPLGGLLIVTFAAWSVPVEVTRKYFNDKLFIIWLWLARLVAPIGIIWVFLANL